jgi:prevent-host-death family protein
MTKTAVVTASELQRASGKVLKRVALGQEHLIVERAGYPVAVMLSYAEYELLLRAQALQSQPGLVPVVEQPAERVDQQALIQARVAEDLKASQPGVQQ